jgi:hypothetical protein
MKAKHFIWLIALALIAYTVADLQAAARPNSKKGIYFMYSLTGGATGSLDSLDITGASTPNEYDLIEGDTAIVTTISGSTVNFYIYVFDASGTDAESSPDIIRPDDYASAGVWRSVDIGSGDVTTHEAAYDHDSYDTHTASTSNPHSVDADDVLDGASPNATLAGGSIDGSATAWTLPPDGPDNLLFSALSDSTSPHNLIESETIEAILTNYGASADAVLDFEDIPIQDGRDFCVIVEAAYQITIEPDTGENWYLNGTQCGADDAIFNDDDTVGETVCCVSTNNNMFCVSQDANWECE